MAGKRGGILPRFGKSAKTPEPEPQPDAQALAASLPPLPRAPTVEHHWLSILVARPGPHDPVPVGGARVVVRAFPRGEARPGDPVARGTTAPDGTVSLLLPAGRYAVSARHEGAGKYATITLEHAGRAVLLLDALGRRVTLTVEVAAHDGRALPGALVEARTVPTGGVAARAVADDNGVAALQVPPGAYEVRLGDAVAKTYVETDTLLRITAGADVPTSEPAAASRYRQKVRAAASYVAPYDVASVRDSDIWN